MRYTWFSKMFLFKNLKISLVFRLLNFFSMPMSLNNPKRKEGRRNWSVMFIRYFCFKTCLLFVSDFHYIFPFNSQFVPEELYNKLLYFWRLTLWQTLHSIISRSFWPDGNSCWIRAFQWWVITSKKGLWCLYLTKIINILHIFFQYHKNLENDSLVQNSLLMNSLIFLKQRKNETSIVQ